MQTYMETCGEGGNEYWVFSCPLFDLVILSLVCTVFTLFLYVGTLFVSSSFSSLVVAVSASVCFLFASCSGPPAIWPFSMILIWSAFE